MFRFYFLALLLICALPVFAQEAQASEETPEQSEVAAPAQEAPAEAAQQEETAAAEQPAEAAPAEETEPAKEEAPAQAEQPAEEAAPAKDEAPAEDGQSDLEAELEAQAAESDSEELAAAEKEKNEEPKKLTVGLNNGFSHGFAKERKSFAYTLNIFASYVLPLDIALSLDVGLRESYSYDRKEASSSNSEEGLVPSEDLDYSRFDGTPLNIGLSKGFPIVAGIMGSIGIGASIPFTSEELWDVYEIRTILGVNLGLAKNFELSEEVVLGLSFGFSYAKTFAEYDAAWDKYANEPLAYLQNHDIGLTLGLSVAYKGFAFQVSGGYSIGSDYKLDTSKYTYDDWDKHGTTDDSSWYYLFSFGATASYSIKGFNFALGVTTNAPEFDNGNYTGFSELPGDPSVKDGSANYPFKAKYTTVFANIGYSYDF